MACDDQATFTAEMLASLLYRYLATCHAFLSDVLGCRPIKLSVRRGLGLLLRNFFALLLKKV